MEADLELDSETLQGDMKHSQPVRKAISIKLKASKVKKRSSKSSKLKKDKSSSENKERERESSLDDRDKSPRRSKSSGHHYGPRFARNGKEELAWDQTINLCGQKVANPVIHTCEKCNLPILVYGRLSPCKHVFCLTCAEEARLACPRCEDKIDRIEPAGIDQIFVCSFGGSRHGVSGCRKSYLSQRDLTAHIRHRHQKDSAASSSAAEAIKHCELQVRQIKNLPFFGNQMFDTQQFLRTNIAPMHPTQPPMDNRLLLSGMQPREQTFMEAPRLAPPSTFPTIQPGQFQSQHGFHSEQGVPRPPMPANVGPTIDGMYLPHSSSAQFPIGANVSRPGASIAPNTVHYHEANQQFLQPAMPLSQAPTVLPPPRMETSLPRTHVEGVPVPRGLDGGWHVGGPPPQHPRPPDNWPQQPATNLVTGYETARYPPPYFK